ncbi:DUF4263 domain-containing protein [Acidiferrimicrobium sp. IK]|uniref:DUF4263 domain-containing protein n=1 Tax=Acidiferrimicrobium sp. IK TaxID=2871700 RepID=UPI0021CAE65D|nr:DUF4263 domain-containing protein [Acidiferrimicrobium sp. IK]MCU4183957.1 DUF4263 domain-containing protein [Acidiferrimicrobium sp. IK]
MAQMRELCARLDAVSENSVERIHSYLGAYVAHYRSAYGRLTSRPPRGAGYPPRPQLSTYLDDSPVECLLGTNGWAIVDSAGIPRNEAWHIAGGPAMMIDYQPTVVPDSIRKLLAEQGILGGNIGIYRIVSPKKLPIEVWTGNFPAPLEDVQANCSGKPVRVKRYNISLEDLLSRLTFGVLSVLDFHIPDEASPFWMTRKLRNIGFTTADRNYRHFFRYIEVGRHLDVAAWDPRSTAARVSLDIRWDYGGDLQDSGGSITFLGSADPPNLDKTLVALAEAITNLERLLNEDRVDSEDVYHQFLYENPILIDVYGLVASKPRFQYPGGHSPIGKEYVEPDFLVQYPDDTYRLIELERPGKRPDTSRGETRAQLTQAAFQIGEWKDYIARHASLLNDVYPGLVAGNFRTAIILGRDSAIALPRESKRYLSLVRQQLAVDEIFTYDALLDRAKIAYGHLSALTV